MNKEHSHFLFNFKVFAINLDTIFLFFKMKNVGKAILYNKAFL